MTRSIRRSSSNIRINCSRIRQAQQDYQNQHRPIMRIATAHYENLRARYAAERAAYHRDLWPDRYRAHRGIATPISPCAARAKSSMAIVSAR